MKWLGVWLLLTAVYVAALVLCRLLTGTPFYGRADLATLVLIPAAQVAALAIVATASAHRHRR
jgi:hypothetical protein